MTDYPAEARALAHSLNLPVGYDRFEEIVKRLEEALRRAEARAAIEFGVPLDHWVTVHHHYPAPSTPFRDYWRARG